MEASLIGMHRKAWTALLAALIAVGAYAHIPLGPVPVSMQTLFVLLAGFLLGPLWGMLSVALYLLAGLVGLPIFAGGKAGLAPLLGPSGGFLMGFLLQAGLAGLARWKCSNPSFTRLMAFGLAGTAAMYALAVPWLAVVLDVNMSKALAVGLTPFLLGALLKLIAASMAARFLLKTGLLPQ